MSQYSEHVKNWKSCKLCGLCKTRQSVVFARGKIPADILVIGEAPSQSDDILGKPFVGPSGKFLNQILKDNLPEHLSLCFTNLVGCVPNGRNHEPPVESIEVCIPKVSELLEICNPIGIIYVGQLASDWLSKRDGFKDVQSVKIVHPAALLRMGEAQRGLSMSSVVGSLIDFTEDLNYV